MAGESKLRQYAFICDYFREHGYVPSVREQQEYMGYSSISSAYNNYVSLLDKGFLATDLDDGKAHPRAYRIVNAFEVANERA